eukprot:GHRQ01027437.1.p1 GENE.GHRQ01027437.1~~GHRQ01027437.1.p1  ORF type:complete len:131 (-),score=14.68 GHRQ01027437.1:284-676(-)
MSRTPHEFSTLLEVGRAVALRYRIWVAVECCTAGVPAAAATALHVQHDVQRGAQSVHLLLLLRKQVMLTSRCLLGALQLGPHMLSDTIAGCMVLHCHVHPPVQLLPGNCRAIPLVCRMVGCWTGPLLRHT